MSGLEPECGPKCRSRQHAYEFLCAITKGNLEEIKAYSKLCCSAAQYSDKLGRWPIHVAAACGKMDVVEWLITDKHGDLTAKDLESGWTALHRSAFYGQLATTRLLLQYNSDMYSRDSEGLGCLDLLNTDRPRYVSFSPTDPTETYTWGDNYNITLGHNSGNRRPHPEVVECFRKENISVRNVVMCKYHTVFMTSSGSVYTCGHGHGGRLGHGDEETCVVPRLVDTVKDEICVQIAAGRDHTVLLMQSGTVFSFGLNDSHQLGQFPVPSSGKSLIPKQVTTKSHKGKKIVGICAGRFHTVMYTSDAVFTFGLNAGQLGHSKGTEKQSQPRQVSALNHSGIVIRMVSSSDAATVILTGNGDLYVLHEYQCRKITSKLLEITRLLVSGGNLDHNTDLDVLREKGGSELIILLLNEGGTVLIWRASLPKLRHCHWAIRRHLIVKDICLSKMSLGIITERGEGFLGTITAARPAKEAPQQHSKGKGNRGHEDHHLDEFGTKLLDFVLKDGFEDVQVRRIPHIHRGLSIDCDAKGHNFSVQQALMNLCVTDVPCVSTSTFIEDFTQLLEEADEYDLIHDVVIQAGGHSWPAHKYILLSRSDYFNKLLAESKKKDTLTDHQIICINDIHPEILEQLLTFLYTDTCNILTPGTRFELSPWYPTEGQGDGYHNTDLEKMENSDILSSKSEKHISAFEIHQKRKSANKENKDHGNIIKTKNPVRMLTDAAKKFGVKGLAKRLETVKYVNGSIELAKKHSTVPRMKFDRHKLRDLYDVSIRADDGLTIQCHKCVLVARLEYFHSMLGSGWVETSDSTSLSLPVTGDILEILIDFLYTDSSLTVEECNNAEFLCNILVSADHMLVTRLKEMCEVSIATLINLKNVSEILEFSCVYNAHQLKAACQEFIYINLAALFEGRHLDVLSDSVMSDLTSYYQNKIPTMSHRIVTPYSDGPTKNFMESLVELEIETENTVISDMGHKKSKSKKRRSRQKSMSEEIEKSGRSQRRDRQISVSSDISVKSEEESLDNIINLLATSPTSSGDQQIPADEVYNTKVCLDKSSAVGTELPRKDKHRTTRKPVTISLTSTGSNSIVTAVNPTSPVSGASVTGVWQKSPTPTGVSSPPGESVTNYITSPTVSLRDIMEEENKRIKSPAKASSKFSWKAAKKQQKSMSPNISNPSQQVTNQQSDQKTTEIPKKAACPWGQINKTVSSFRDLMSEDSKSVDSNKAKKASVTSKETAPTVNKGAIPKPTAISWGIPTRGVHINNPHIDSHEVAAVSPQEQENPWKKRAITSPSTVSSVSFTDIVRDEQQKSDMLAKVAKKPLGLIQIEEKAIQELLDHYGASHRLDENITVERVTQEMATPLWKKS